jgi:hypothetical protein
MAKLYKKPTKLQIVHDYFKKNVDTARGCAEETGINEATVRGCINTLLNHYKIVCLYSRREPQSIRRVKRYTSNSDIIYYY